MQAAQAQMDVHLFATKIIVVLHVLIAITMNGRIVVSVRITIIRLGWDGEVLPVIGANVVVVKQKLFVIQHSLDTTVS